MGQDPESPMNKMLDLKYRPVDQYLQQKVAQVLQNDNLDMVVAKFASRSWVLNDDVGIPQSVTLRDFRSLLQKRWINDSIVNFYMAMLEVRNQERRASGDFYQQNVPLILCFNSYWYTKLVDDGYADREVQQPNGSRRHIRGVERWTRPEKVKYLRIVLTDLYVMME